MWQDRSEKNNNSREFWDWRLVALLWAMGLCVFGVMVVLFILGWNYGRMKYDDAVNVYQMTMPRLDHGAIPVTGGIARLKEVVPKELQNPLIPTRENLDQGRERYDYYCVQCHGPGGKGYGTVGQSFAPLPTDLAGKSVQGQTDGEIFVKSMLGYKRHPSLADTVSEPELWAIVLYLRTLK